jgi:FKBP-type peptidyl-prolyl cis-trans isomerase FklB
MQTLSHVNALQLVLFYPPFSVIIMFYAACITRIKSIPLKQRKKHTMAIELNTLTQRLSYIVGENMAHQLKNDGLALDADVVALAVKDVMDDTPSRLTDAEKRSTVEQVQKESQEKQMAAQAEQSAKKPS